ncbi:hypothetical protein FSP39_006632 [Pinctada imbricata]|uniref:Uncharacterized protein n=1 Tax=Pinctada imbricata TaxID=66713 RepID=A0AA88YAQ9_PINIB|nr:hypothetical protein FSP39_006632 [Pinctada imbricata]
MTTMDRELFPVKMPRNRFGNEIVPLRGTPHTGPGCYENEDFETPCPTEYQQNNSRLKEFMIDNKPFLVGADRFPIYKRDIVDVLPGPGTYEHQIPRNRKVQWHQAFGGAPVLLPEITVQSTINKNTEKAVIPAGSQVLLDVDDLDIKSITIEKGASLVFDDIEATVRVNYILVKGSLILGSESCPLTAHIEIILKGDPKEYTIDGFGEKFIGVEQGGTLEIHGDYKLPWTKLDSTVKRLEDGMVDKLRNLPQFIDDKNHDTYKGLAVYVMDPATGQIEDKFSAITGFEWNQCLTDKAAEEFEEKMNALPDGKIVGIALKRRLGEGRNLAMFYEILEKLAFGSVTKTTKIRQYKFHSAWAMIFKKGDPSQTKEDIVFDDGVVKDRAIELYLVENGMKFSIRSWVHTIRRGACYSEAKVSQADISIPTIKLVDNVDTWKEGDNVVLLSTDFDMKQAEEAVVAPCSTCASNEIQVNIEPKFTHFGEIVHNVDMRGEVAVLNRNIVIRGEESSKSNTFGGHLKVLRGFTDVHIENAEFVNMGQQESIGNYPIHFHMCMDVDNYTRPAYVRGNSIHDTKARCITVHGTSGLLVKDNVCYRSLGHGFFLEDGGEKRTVFDGNLGALTNRGTLIVSDRVAPSTFWITNPNTYMRNNVAAGSMSIGIWFLYPDYPLGPSSDLMKKFEAQHTAVPEFYNNVAHSNARSGLFFENKLSRDGKPGAQNRYEPWNDPLNKTSGDKMVVFEKFTAYKNIRQNAWIDGGLITVKKSSFSDSVTGLTFVRSSPQVQFVTESVFLGDSPNMGQPSIITALRTYPRSVPLSMLNQPRQGFVYYDGPVHVSDSWFGNFEKTADYDVGALAFQRANLGHSSPFSTAKGLQFGFKDPSGGNRVFDGNSTDAGFSNLDGDDVATFRDLDGSVTNIAGSQVVKPLPFHLTSSCQKISNWKMAICPGAYGQVEVRWREKAKNVIISRDDDPENLEVSGDKVLGAPFLAILGGSHSYMARYDGEMPSQTWFVPHGISKTGWVRVGLCVPRDAKLDVRMRDGATKGWTRGVSVDSVDKVDNGAVKDYYFDVDVGIVFLKIVHAQDFTSSDVTGCPENFCLMHYVRVVSGDKKDTDCSARAFKKYKRSSSSLKVKFKMVIQVGFQSSETPTPRQTDLFILRRLLCLGRAPKGQGKYVSREVRDDFKMEEFICINRLIQAGRGTEVLNTIEKYSCHGLTFQQNAILFALAICCRADHLRTKRAAFVLMRKVCRIPTFLFTFVTYYHSLKHSKGWGKCMKRAISDLYNNYEGGIDRLLRHVTKYQRRKGMSHKDIIRLAHVKPNSRTVAFVLKYLAKGYQAIQEYSNRNLEADQELQQSVCFLRATHDAKRCQSDRHLKQLIENHRLTHDFVPSEKLRDPEIWRTLLPFMPFHALIRNLGRMTAVGALSNQNEIERIRLRLGDSDAVRQSFVHPFQLLNAFMHYESGVSAPDATENLGRITWRPNSDVLKSLEEAFYSSLTDINFIRPVQCNIQLALDLGLSRGQCVNTAESLPVCTAVWALMLAFIRTQAPQDQDDEGHSCKVVAFSGSSCVPLPIARTDRLADIEQHLINSTGLPDSDQSPDLSAPIRRAASREHDIDLFVILTSCSKGRLVQSPEEALSSYRASRRNQEVKLVVVIMGTEQAHNLWNSDDPRILIIEGFDANVFHLIREFVTSFD